MVTPGIYIFNIPFIFPFIFFLSYSTVRYEGSNRKWSHDLQKRTMLSNISEDSFRWISEIHLDEFQGTSKNKKTHAFSDTSDYGFEGNEHLLKISLHVFSDLLISNSCHLSFVFSLILLSPEELVWFIVLLIHKNIIIYKHKKKKEMLFLVRW